MGHEIPRKHQLGEMLSLEKNGTNTLINRLKVLPKSVKSAAVNIMSRKRIKISVDLYDGVSFQFRILLLMSVVIITVMGVLGTAAYFMGKNRLQQYADGRLTSSAANVSEKIDLFTSTVDSREIMRKVKYIVGVENAAFSRQGLHPSIHIVDQQGNEVFVSAGNQEELLLSPKWVKNIASGRAGLETVESQKIQWRVAYQQIPGKNWIYIVGIPVEEYLTPVKQLRNLIILGGAAAILAAVLIGVIGARKFAKPLNELTGIMSQVGDGNLTLRAKETKVGKELSSLGASFNLMLSDLGGLIKDFGRTAAELHQTSLQMYRVGENQVRFALKAEENADKMAEVVKDVTRQAAEAEITSRKTMLLAEEGLQGLRQVVEKIKKNRQLAHDSSDAVQSLTQHIQEISKIVDIIKNISQQTNLLSLNASIEAARAGEKGRGFAVVAEEVRKLAEAAEQSTEDVRQIIHLIQAGASEVLNQVEAAEKMADQGAAAVVQTENALSGIYRSVLSAGEQVSRIADGTSEISKQMKETVYYAHVIAGTKEDDEQTTERISAREVELQAGRVADMAEQMRSQLKRFVVAA